MLIAENLDGGGYGGGYVAPAPSDPTNGGILTVDSGVLYEDFGLNTTKKLGDVGSAPFGGGTTSTGGCVNCAPTVPTGAPTPVSPTTGAPAPVSPMGATGKQVESAIKRLPWWAVVLILVGVGSLTRNA